MNNIKTIYEFEINVEKEVDKIDIVKDGDKETTIKTKVKELVPVYFAFKKPSRSEREAAEEYRAECWSKFLERGIISQAVLEKHFANSGGLMSETDKEEKKKLEVSLEDKIKEYQLKPDSEDNKEVKNELMKNIIELRNLLLNFDRKYSTYYDKTAESKSHVKVIEFLILNLSLYKEDKTKDWTPFFIGDSLQKKYDNLEKKEDDNDELYLKSKNKLSFIASLYLSLGAGINKDEIAAFEKEFGL